MNEHTGLPWKRDGVHLYKEGDGHGSVCACGSPRKSQYVQYIRLDIGDPDFDEAFANAAFIVRAANNFYGLLEACKASEDAMCRATFDLKGRNCGDLNHAIDLVKQAIASTEQET